MTTARHEEAVSEQNGPEVVAWAMLGDGEVRVHFRRTWVCTTPLITLSSHQQAVESSEKEVDLLYWIINNLLTDSQLDVVPPGLPINLRFISNRRNK